MTHDEMNDLKRSIRDLVDKTLRCDAINDERTKLTYELDALIEATKTARAHIKAVLQQHHIYRPILVDRYGSQTQIVGLVDDVVSVDEAVWINQLQDVYPVDPLPASDTPTEAIAERPSPVDETAEFESAVAVRKDGKIVGFMMP